MIVNEIDVECVMLPLVPVMVSGKVPVEGCPPVVMVSVDVPEPVTDDGLKLALVPRGRPLTLRLTAPVKPFNAPMVIVDDVLDFAPMVDGDGDDAVIEKSPPPPEVCTTSVTLVVWLSVPSKPVMVSGNVPVGVVLPVVIDREEVVLLALTEVGVNVAVAFAGKPLALRDAVPV